LHDLNTARYSLAGDGTQTSALAFGGQLVPPNVTAMQQNLGMEQVGRKLQI
jgi:hypothetical protein